MDPKRAINKFWVNRHIRRLFVVLMVLAMILFVQAKFVSSQKRQMAKVMIEQHLVMRIQEMEQMLKDDTTDPKPVKRIAKPAFTPTLEGVAFKEGKLYVLIDDTIYEEGDIFFFDNGDLIDEYKIIEITMSSAVLVNKFTHKMRNLYLEE